MKNKLLVKIYVVCISEEYEIIIPVNETVKTVIGLIVNSISELSDGRLASNGNYCLMDADLGQVYSYSTILRDTNVVNSKRLFLI